MSTNSANNTSNFRLSPKHNHDLFQIPTTYSKLLSLFDFNRTDIAMSSLRSSKMGREGGRGGGGGVVEEEEEEEKSPTTDTKTPYLLWVPERFRKVIRTISVWQPEQREHRWGLTLHRQRKGGRRWQIEVCVCRRENGDLDPLCLIHQREKTLLPSFWRRSVLTGTGKRGAFIPTPTKSYLLLSRTCCLSLAWFSSSRRPFLVQAELCPNFSLTLEAEVEVSK